MSELSWSYDYQTSMCFGITKHAFTEQESSYLCRQLLHGYQSDITVDDTQQFIKHHFKFHLQTSTNIELWTIREGMKYKMSQCVMSALTRKVYMPVESTNYDGTEN